MRITVDIADPLFDGITRLAAQESTTLDDLVDAGLRHILRQRQSARAFVLRDARVGGRGLQPEFRDANWERIRDAAYRRCGR